MNMLFIPMLPVKSEFSAMLDFMSNGMNAEDSRGLLRNNEREKKKENIAVYWQEFVFFLKANFSVPFVQFKDN